MKSKLFIGCLLLLGSFTAKSQTSNAILFTENGERFQVVLNGILQNAKAETNVKMTGLAAPNYKCKIIFEDKSLGYVDFNLFFPEMGYEATWSIKKNKKGEYVTRGVSAVPIAQAPPTAPAQTTIVYSETPAVESSSTTVQKTTTTTTTGGNADGINMNVGINVQENGGGMNMNVSGIDGSSAGSTTTTTTTTHTRTVTTTNDPPPPTVVYVEGYNGKTGCVRPMSSSEFNSFKSSVQSKSFEDSKLTVAKQAINNNCLTSAQVKDVMMLFSFEATRLDFAKYAYGHTYDTGNYYKINDAFTFESSIDELNTYINGR